MASNFSDAVGKRVVAQNGTPVGTVTEVRDDELVVEVSGEIEDETLGELRWEGVVNQEQKRLNPKFISTITEETVRLRV